MRLFENKTLASVLGGALVLLLSFSGLPHHPASAVAAGVDETRSTVDVTRNIGVGVDASQTVTLTLKDADGGFITDRTHENHAEELNELVNLSASVQWVNGSEWDDDQAKQGIYTRMVTSGDAGIHLVGTPKVSLVGGDFKSIWGASIGQGNLAGLDLEEEGTDAVIAQAVANNTPVFETGSLQVTLTLKSAGGDPFSDLASSASGAYLDFLLNLNAGLEFASESSWQEDGNTGVYTRDVTSKVVGEQVVARPNPGFDDTLTAALAWTREWFSGAALGDKTSIILDADAENVVAGASRDVRMHLYDTNNVAVTGLANQNQEYLTGLVGDLKDDFVWETNDWVEGDPGTDSGVYTRGVISKIARNPAAVVSEPNAELFSPTNITPNPFQAKWDRNIGDVVLSKSSISVTRTESVLFGSGAQTVRLTLNDSAGDPVKQLPLGNEYVTNTFNGYLSLNTTAGITWASGSAWVEDAVNPGQYTRNVVSNTVGEGVLVGTPNTNFGTVDPNPGFTSVWVSGAVRGENTKIKLDHTSTVVAGQPRTVTIELSSEPTGMTAVTGLALHNQAYLTGLVGTLGANFAWENDDWVEASGANSGTYTRGVISTIVRDGTISVSQPSVALFGGNITPDPFAAKWDAPSQTDPVPGQYTKITLHTEGNVPAGAPREVKMQLSSQANILAPVTGLQTEALDALISLNTAGGISWVDSAWTETAGDSGIYTRGVTSKAAGHFKVGTPDELFVNQITPAGFAAAWDSRFNLVALGNSSIEVSQKDSASVGGQDQVITMTLRDTQQRGITGLEDEQDYLNSLITLSDGVHFTDDQWVPIAQAQSVNGFVAIGQLVNTDGVYVRGVRSGTAGNITIGQPHGSFGTVEPKDFTAPWLPITVNVDPQTSDFTITQTPNIRANGVDVQTITLTLRNADGTLLANAAAEDVAGLVKLGADLVYVGEFVETQRGVSGIYTVGVATTVPGDHSVEAFGKTLYASFVAVDENVLPPTDLPPITELPPTEVPTSDGGLANTGVSLSQIPGTFAVIALLFGTAVVTRLRRKYRGVA